MGSYDRDKRSLEVPTRWTPDTNKRPLSQMTVTSGQDPTTFLSMDHVIAPSAPLVSFWLLARWETMSRVRPGHVIPSPAVASFRQATVVLGSCGYAMGLAAAKGFTEAQGSGTRSLRRSVHATTLIRSCPRIRAPRPTNSTALLLWRGGDTMFHVKRDAMPSSFGGWPHV